MGPSFVRVWSSNENFQLVLRCEVPFSVAQCTLDLTDFDCVEHTEVNMVTAKSFSCYCIEVESESGAAASGFLFSDQSESRLGHLQAFTATLA
jgi:hypothetical protein